MRQTLGSDDSMSVISTARVAGQEGFGTRETIR
jgi:hypothetical protein